MPELPEVETVCRGLAKHLTGKRIQHVTVRRRDLRLPVPRNLEKALKGRLVKRISRRAKYILFHLDNKEVLIVHLGMSGSIVLKDILPIEYRKHDHVIIECAGGMLFLFHDPRRFGLMVLAPEEVLSGHVLFAGLGPEPLDASWSGTHLYKVLQPSRVPVKSVIMDQRKVVGVGNIYACEALFRARIHPARSANKVTKKEANALAASIKQVLEAAIDSGGSTLRDYVRSSGDAGYFQHHFNVYARQKLPCPVCGNPVRVIRQSGRSTFFVLTARNKSDKCAARFDMHPRMQQEMRKRERLHSATKNAVQNRSRKQGETIGLQPYFKWQFFVLRLCDYYLTRVIDAVKLSILSLAICYSS